MKELKRHLSRKTSNGISWLVFGLAFFISSIAIASAWQVTIIESEQLVLSFNLSLAQAQSNNSPVQPTLIYCGPSPATCPSPPPPPPPPPPPGGGIPTTPNLKVAFIGDQGLGSNAQAVLQMIKDEGADLVIHSGDFEYTDDPAAWDQQINDILGPNFPYFASPGNHDEPAWSGYQQKLQERLQQLSGASCSGDLGVKSSCTYEGLFFILSGAGTLGSSHTSYIQDQLAQDNHIWRICSWHKNQTAMQVGTKGDAVGWGPYEACRQAGAIITTGHEHSYERTKSLTSMQNQTVDSACPDNPATSDIDVCVEPGSTFAFVSGIAGKSIRNQDRCLPSSFPYGCNGEWAKIYTSDQGADYGALFITFNVNNDPNKATAYFKNINGQIIDEFEITKGGVPPPPSPPSGSELRMWLVSDIQARDNTEWQSWDDSVADALANISFDEISFVGDITQSSTILQWLKWLQSVTPLQNYPQHYLAGNHEFHDPDNYQNYIISTFQGSGTPDWNYAIQRGNAMFIYMSDSQASSETEIPDSVFNWWQSLVSNNQDKIIFTFTHTALPNTLPRSDDPQFQVELGQRFTDWLQASGNNIDIWFSGHSHQIYSGGADYDFSYGFHHINTDAIATWNYNNDVPNSKLMILQEGSDQAIIKIRRHDLQQFINNEEMTIQLRHPYQP